MVLTAKKAARHKIVLRRSIAASHGLKGISLFLEMAEVVRKSIGKKNECP